MKIEQLVRKRLFQGFGLMVGLWVIGSGCQSKTVNPDRSLVVQLVDSQGNAVETANLATVWSANGKYWNEDGEYLEFTEENLAKVWDDEGEMQPLPTRKLQHLGEGRFSLPDPTKNLVTLVAIDSDTETGGVAVVAKGTRGNLKMRLEPLVQVHGMIRCEDAIPEWTHVYVYVPGTPEVPS